MNANLTNIIHPLLYLTNNAPMSHILQMTNEKYWQRDWGMTKKRR